MVFDLSGSCRVYNFATGYRISSNNSRGRLFLFSHKKGAIIRGKAIISNIAHWKLNKPDMGFSNVPNLVPLLFFRVESSLISFAGSPCTST